MASEIDPNLLPLTSGPHIGKLSADDLRTQLATARDESTEHEERIDAVVESLETLSQATDTALTALDTSIPGKVRAALLTGISFASGLAVVAGDTVLGAIGKLQKQITDHLADVKGHLSQAQKDNGATGVVGAKSNGNVVVANGVERQLNQANQMLRAGFTPDRIIATGQDGIGVAGGWSVASGSLSLETSNVRRAGNPVLKIQGNTGGASSTYIRRKISPVSLTSAFNIALNVPKPSIGTVDIYFAWTSTAPANDPPSGAFTNPRQIFIPSTEVALGAWMSFKCAPASKRFSTGAVAGRSWYSTQTLPVDYLEGVEISFVWSATVPDAERVAYLDCIGINGKTKPMIMLGFDGFYASQASVALPLLQKYGFKAYSSSSGNAIAANKSTTDTLYAAGWDIVSQAQRNINGSTPNNYATDPSHLADDLASAREQFNAAGYKTAQDWFTYPQNARSSVTDAILAAAGYKFAGSTAGASFPQSNLGDGGLLQIGRYCTDLNNTAVQMQAALDEAIINGSHMMYFGHNLVVTVTDPTIQTNIAEFTTFIAYLASKYYAGEVDVVTPSEFLQRI